MTLERRDEVVRQLREGILGVANLYGAHTVYRFVPEYEKILREQERMLKEAL